MLARMMGVASLSFGTLLVGKVKRCALFAFACLLLLIGQGVTAASNAPLQQSIPERPNIVVLLLDDAGYNDFSERELIRPNIDRLVSQSLRVDPFYTAPMCSPTRTSLLTARYPARYGLQWVYGRKTHRGIDTGEDNLVKLLNRAGYATAHFGKWHAGQGEGYSVFDIGYDYAIKPRGVVPHGYHDPVIHYADGKSRHFEGRHLTDVMTDHVVEYLRNRVGFTEPFFMNVWFNAPHGPHQPSERWLSRYATSDPHRKYKALFSQADENIGRILEAIDANPAWRNNTLVLLASDNGGTPATRVSNGELRGFKKDVFEGGIRSPLYLRWPGTFEPGRSSGIVTALDLPTTFLSLAGVGGLDDRDGENLAPYFSRQLQDIGKQRRLFWMHKVKGDHKGRRKFDPAYAQHSWAVREGNWKVVYEPLDSGSPMLFDLSTDPGEKKDLAALMPSRVDQLYMSYLDWKRQASQLPLQIEALNGSVTQSQHALHFSQGASGIPGRVEYGYHPLQNITDQDFTFMVSIRLASRESVGTPIASQPGAWSLRVNADGGLALTLSGQRGRQQTIVSRLKISPGVRYELVFSIVGMKNLPNYVRLFSRTEGQQAFQLVGEGVGIASVGDNQYPIQLGGGPGDSGVLNGELAEPAFFLAPFNLDELNHL